MDETLLNILGDRLSDKIQQANTYYLKKIGEAIKRIRNLTPTQAHQLVQMLKYSGDYEKILGEISKLAGVDLDDIDKIFAEYSKNDLNFAKKFYEYKNVPFIPFEENMALKMQTEALANITKNEMANLTRSRGIGYVIRDIEGNEVFYGLRETYEKVLDEALLNVGQGKDTFDNSMFRVLKELGGSGIRKLEYESGRSYRLDSMVRMHLKSGLRELHNENQKLFGKQYGADGVEISVHLNPAPDHAEIQGRQFSNGEFAKVQKHGMGIDYKDNFIDITTGVEKISHRPISEYNCYHYTFAIVLGVSKPRYSDEELKKIIDDNNKGFDYEGKHYTMYEGTQLMRSIERRVREQKDINILAKASDNSKLDYNSRYKITVLSNKYKEVSQVSGLPTKANRMRVSGYTGRPVKIEPKTTISIEKPKTFIDDYTFKISKDYQIEKNNLRIEQIKTELKKDNSDMKMFRDYAIKRGNDPEKSGDYNSSHYRIIKNSIKKKKEMLEELKNKEFEDKTIVLKDYDSCKELLDTSNISMDESMKTLDNKLLVENTAQLYRLNRKYPIVENEINKRKLSVSTLPRSSSRTYARTTGVTLEYNKSYFNDYEDLKRNHISDGRTNWHYMVDEDKATIYTTTHEYGHILQQRYTDAYNLKHTYKSWKEFDDMTMEGIYDIAKKETKMNITELKTKYLTDYGKSKRNYEAFAEIYAGMELGIDNPLTKAMKEYLEDMEKWM